MSKQEKTSKNQLTEAPEKVAEVFSLTRDVDVLHPYHMDGDVDMYTEEQVEAREALRNDPDIGKLLTEIVGMYEWSEVEGLGKVVLEKSYKMIQRQLALILRPTIDKQELEFVVDRDWEHDRLTTQTEKHYINKQKLVEALFELVDVWTQSTQKQEYVSFSRLLKKKIERALKLLK